MGLEMPATQHGATQVQSATASTMMNRGGDGPRMEDVPIPSSMGSDISKFATTTTTTTAKPDALTFSQTTPQAVYRGTNAVLYRVGVAGDMQVQMKRELR